MAKAQQLEPHSEVDGADLEFPAGELLVVAGGVRGAPEDPGAAWKMGRCSHD